MASGWWLEELLFGEATMNLLLRFFGVAIVALCVGCTDAHVVAQHNPVPVVLSPISSSEYVALTATLQDICADFRTEETITREALRIIKTHAPTQSCLEAADTLTAADRLVGKLGATLCYAPDEIAEVRRTLATPISDRAAEIVHLRFVSLRLKLGWVTELNNNLIQLLPLDAALTLRALRDVSHDAR